MYRDTELGGRESALILILLKLSIITAGQSAGWAQTALYIHVEVWKS